MKPKGISTGGIIFSTIMLTICAIAMIALLLLYELTSKLSGSVAVIFAALNLIVLWTMVTIGRTVAAQASFATSVQLWLVTIIYTLVQFIVLFAAADVWSVTAYTLVQLFVVVICFAIANAIFFIGMRNYRRKEK